MRGSVFLRCACRDPETGKFLHGRCPKLGKVKGHGAWRARYSVVGPGGKRRQPMLGPFPTKRAAEETLAETLARIAGGGPAVDRTLTVAAYLTGYLAGKLDLKPRSLASSREAVELYWIPALGHLRLADLRDTHIAEAVREMLKINRPLPGGEQPGEVLRRLLAARAPSPRKELRAGDPRRKSTKPLSPARVARVFAVLRAALNAAVPSRIAFNPCDGVTLPRARQAKPLPWTPQREAAFRTALDKAIRGASADGVVTVANRQRLWASPQLRPSPVMVWLPSQCGQFLDFIEPERLYALFALAAYCGLRRGEILGLKWSEVDLDEGAAYVRETAEDDTPKSAAGIRPVPLPQQVVRPLRAWRAQQSADRMAWGADWPDTGLVFTREDGTPVPAQWASVRFEILAYRSGLPPVRFHDLRHGAASLAHAAGLPGKYIAALLGHARSSFTADTYVSLFPQVARASAETAAAAMPRRDRQNSSAPAT
jgi:integrase